MIHPFNHFGAKLRLLISNVKRGTYEVLTEALKNQMEKGENIRSPSIRHEWLHRLDIREICSKTVRPVPRILLKPLFNHPKQITLGIFMVAPYRTKLSKVFISQTHLGKDSRDRHCGETKPFSSTFILVHLAHPSRNVRAKLHEKYN